MNILMAVHHFPPRHNEGAEQRSLRTALALRARGHSVRVVCVGNPDTPGARGLTWEDREHCGIDVRELFFQRKALPWQAEFDNRLIGEHIREMLTAEHFDLLHLFSGYLMSGSPLLAARELGVPSVVSLTDFWFLCQRIQMLRSDGTLSTTPIKAATCARCIAEDSRRYRLPAQVAPALATAFWHKARERTARVAARMQFLSEALGSAAFVISPSRFLRDMFIESGVNPHQIVFSRQGREFSTIDPALLKKTPSATLRLGYLGQIIPVKGVHVAIDAMAQLRDLPVSLDIYGPTGHDTSYSQRCAATAAANERIKIHGAYERSALTRVLQSLDVLVVPSTWYENSPNVILEALAHKTPVITSNLGGMAELIQHEHNGLVFETGNALDLSRQIRRLLESPELRARLSAEITPVKTVQEEIDEIETLYAQAAGTAHLRRFDATTAHFEPGA
jgi:glycosyltransferase involved in cell wall biosynthesis